MISSDRVQKVWEKAVHVVGYDPSNNGQRKRATFRSDRIGGPEVMYVNCTVESEYPIVLEYSQFENPA